MTSKPFESMAELLEFLDTNTCRCGSSTNLRKMCGTDQMERLGIQFYKCAECDAQSDEDDDYEETDDECEEGCIWCSADTTDGYKLKPEGLLDDYLSDVMACRECGQGFLTDNPNHGHKKNQEQE